MKILFVIFLFHLSFCFSSEFEKGLEFSQKGNWLMAQEFFEQHLKQYPEDGKALFNLGLCHYHTKDFLNAIYFLEKAYKLDPKLDECRIPIESCRQELGLTGGWEEPNSFFTLKMFKLSLNTWSVISICFSVLSALLLFFLLRFKQARNVLGPFLIGSIILLGFSLFFTIRKATSLTCYTHGIISFPIQKTFTEELGSATINLHLSPGERVEVVKVKKRVEIRLKNQLTTWVEKENIRLF